MNETEVNAKVQEWEAQGFKFVGNGSEAPDDNPLLCPSCGRPNTFWALWEHSTTTQYADPDSEPDPSKLNSANLCMVCGYRWVEED